MSVIDFLGQLSALPFRKSASSKPSSATGSTRPGTVPRAMSRPGSVGKTWGLVDDPLGLGKGEETQDQKGWTIV